jgi:hypothetical protein
MAFTYDPTELKDSDLFQVRLKTGQTNEFALLVLQDEEIQYFLDNNLGDVNKTAIDVLDTMISNSHSFVDKLTGQVSESQSQIIDNLIKLRDDLLRSLSRNVPEFMQFTGVFEQDRKEVHLDEDIFHDGIFMETKGPDGE